MLRPWKNKSCTNLWTQIVTSHYVNIDDVVIRDVLVVLIDVQRCLEVFKGV
jgi:hypothetical protein